MGRARGAQHLAPGHRRRAPYKWSLERIESELRQFLGDRTTWPTSEDFKQSGKTALLAAVQRSPGGSSHWAGHFGIELRPMQDRAPYPLDTALAEARDLIASHGRLPNMLRLRELGHPRLAYLVEKAGGAQAFCAKHRLDS